MAGAQPYVAHSAGTHSGYHCVCHWSMCVSTPQMTPSLACGQLSLNCHIRLRISHLLLACILTRSFLRPALCAANKCVFCWRHGSNPIGKEWRWLTDDPAYLVNEAMEQHRRMIAAMKGVPGVLPDRLADALKPRHCALSLVGEPIMSATKPSLQPHQLHRYAAFSPLLTASNVAVACRCRYPHINEFVRLLHSHGISSFLVSNAQFPDRVQQLQPVTQLYLSIDAATAQSLKTIDRPLFRSVSQSFIQRECELTAHYTAHSLVALVNAVVAVWTVLCVCVVCRPLSAIIGLAFCLVCVHCELSGSGQCTA